MKLKVDRDLCQAHGVCASEAPEVFELDQESGELVLLQQQPPQDLRSKVELAVKYCPTRALSLEEA